MPDAPPVNPPAADPLTAALDAYLATSGYDVDASVADAKLFVKACRQLLLLLPRGSADERTRTDLSPDLIREQLNAARSWLAGLGEIDNEDSLANADAGETALDFSHYRCGAGYGHGREVW